MDFMPESEQNESLFLCLEALVVERIRQGPEEEEGEGGLRSGSLTARLCHIVFSIAESPRKNVIDEER